MFSSLTLADIVILLVSLLVSMTIHEFMHSYAGYLLGDRTAKMEGRLSLNPLRHIDPFMTVIMPIVSLFVFGFIFMAAKPVPFNPLNVRYREFGAAILAAAGPLSNLVLAIIAALVYHAATFGSPISKVAEIFGFINVFLFVFNLIPIPPLDGSRVVYAFMPEAIQEFMQRIEPYGFFIVIAAIFILAAPLTTLYTDVFHLLGLPSQLI